MNILQDFPLVQIVTPPPFITSQCNYLDPGITADLNNGFIEDPVCRAVASLEETAAKIEPVDCWSHDAFSTNTLPTEIQIPLITKYEPLQMSARSRPVPTGIHIKARKDILHGFPIHIHRNTKRMHDEGMGFAITLMKDLPMRQVIRYRSATLRQLEKKANELDFIGICLVIPPAPLQLKTLKSVNKMHFAVGTLKGIPNLHYGSHAWVVYRVRKTGDIDALATRIEE